MIRGFIMTPEIAQEFFRRCMEREAHTEPERVAILNELAREYATKVEAFNADMTQEQLVNELAKKVKVYTVRKRKPDEPLQRNEVPSCGMCRAALHKKCEKQACTCQCERGY